MVAAETAMGRCVDSICAQHFCLHAAQIPHVPSENNRTGDHRRRVLLRLTLVCLTKGSGASAKSFSGQGMGTAIRPAQYARRDGRSPCTTVVERYAQGPTKPCIGYCRHHANVIALAEASGGRFGANEGWTLVPRSADAHTIALSDHIALRLFLFA